MPPPAGLQVRRGQVMTVATPADEIEPMAPGARFGSAPALRPVAALGEHSQAVSQEFGAKVAAAERETPRRTPFSRGLFPINLPELEFRRNSGLTAGVARR